IELEDVLVLLDRLAPGEVLHPDPPVLCLGHEPAARVALLKLPERPVRLRPVPAADLRQRPEPAGLVPPSRLGVLPLEALQRLGCRGELALLEREPAEE